MSEIDLPGFRFHPTDEELLEFYLRRVIYEKMKLNVDVIGTLNIYRHDPWELPNLAKIGEREWYFYVPRDRRQANGGRPNRTTERGFWKATGSDRSIRSAADPKRIIGLRKTLVFYTGRAPRGGRTDWVMNEYRLPDSPSSAQHTKDMVLCKVYRKATSLKELEQRAAMEEETRASSFGSLSATTDTFSSSEQENLPFSMPFYDEEVKEVKQVLVKEPEVSSTTMLRSVDLPELQVPMSGLEWMHDSFLTQLRSPWMEQWSPYCANILNS